MNITLSEAIQLTARLEAGYQERNLLGAIMPNGKPLAKCTGEDIRQLVRAMEEFGFRLDQALAAIK
jgi:hypothetical protein